MLTREDEEKVEKAMRAVHAEELGGRDFNAISDGQRQRVLLARAICQEPEVIILDEPTAALDPVSEHEIYERFNQFVGAKTAIYISHRLSSCRFCDQIAVFDQGRLIQTGSHDELLADEQGKYHELWHAHAQYYVPAEECAANNT